MKVGGINPSQDQAQSSVLGPQSFNAPALNALLLLFILNFTLQPLTEPDFGWHLRTGLDLLAHEWRLPPSDPYSHTMPDWRWVEHAWLTDALIAAVYSHSGGLGVIFLFGLIAAAAWLIASTLSSSQRHYRWLACVLSLWVALPYLGARTQLVSLLGFAALLYVLTCRERRIWWAIPLLFLLWANLHGGFPVGLFFLVLVATTTWTLRWMLGRWPILSFRLDEAILSRADVIRLALLTALSGLTTFANPYGWRLHREIFDSLSNQFMLFTLQEWQPLTLATGAGRTYAIYLVGLSIATLLWYRRFEPVRWVVWVVFLALSLRHMRNIPIFLIVSLPLCADLVAAALGRLESWLVQDRAAAKQWAFAVTCAAALFLIWLGPDHVQHIVHSGTQPARYFEGTSYPIEAVEWVQANRDRLGTRLYNDYGHGGFLLWWLPGEKIFIDGRMPAWHIDGRNIFEDYVALTAGERPALSILDKYAVDWALVRRESLLDQALNHESSWTRAYEDRKVSIFVRL